MAFNASSEGHRVLYHWEKFCEERLSALIRDNRIYCTNPASFNDPWDCKPHLFVITGCQSNHQRIHDPVKSIDPKVDVKQASRVPNRFEILISQ